VSADELLAEVQRLRDLANRTREPAYGRKSKLQELKDGLAALEDEAWLMKLESLAS
jgi:hypothetical protein